MKYLRLAAILIFLLSLGLGTWANYEYTKRKDSTPPVLRCESGEDFLELSVTEGPDALLAGLTAYDETDGDLTDRIMVASTSRFLEPGTFTVKYVVFDSQNNSAVLTRTVHYTDYTSPQFSLSQPLVYTKGDEIHYLDYVTAYDVLDGEITDRIKVKSSYVSSYTADLYPVVLEVSNSYGDTVQVELNVVVQEAGTNTVQIQLKQYLVYIRQGQQFSPESCILSVTDEDGVAFSRQNVRIQGSVDTGQPGCYQLEYCYTDGSRQGQTYLTVVVSEEDG